MPRKNHKPEEIVAKLSQVVLTSPGKPTDDMIRAIGVTEVMHYRCVREYVGLRSDQFKRMQHLQAEVGKAVSDLMLEEMKRKGWSNYRSVFQIGALTTRPSRRRPVSQTGQRRPILPGQTGKR